MTAVLVDAEHVVISAKRLREKQPGTGTARSPESFSAWRSGPSRRVGAGLVAGARR